MKVAIYARVSTEKQAQEGTIESQIVALREYAAADSHEILEECIDDGYSGTNLVRPGLDRLRDLAHQGLVDAVVMLSPDRLARKHVHQVVILEELEKRHVKVIFTNYRLGDTPEDNLLLGIQGLFSEYERTKLLDRTRRGRIQAAKNGHVIGGIAPYGYRLIHKTKDTPAHYEVNPLEADTVRLIFRLITEEKLSLRATAKNLNQTGIPTRSGSQWCSSTLAGIVSNEAYIGNAYAFRHVCIEPSRPRGRTPYPKVKNTSKKIRPQADWIQIPIEAIIGQATFDAARAQMALNIDRSPRNSKRHDYLLRLLTVCGLCGCHISGTSGGGRSYYRCYSKRSGTKHAIRHNDIVAVRHPKLDSLVWDALVDLLDDPARLEAHLAKRHELPQEQPPSPDLQAHEQASAKMDAEEERLLDAYREKIIDLAQLKRQMGKLTEKRTHQDAVRRALARRTEPLERPRITREMLGDLSSRYRRAMSNADFTARRQIVESLVTGVTLYPGKAVVSGVIPIDDGGLRPLFRAPTIDSCPCRADLSAGRIDIAAPRPGDAGIDAAHQSVTDRAKAKARQAARNAAVGAAPVGLTVVVPGGARLCQPVTGEHGLDPLAALLWERRVHADGHRLLGHEHLVGFVRLPVALDRHDAPIDLRHPHCDGRIGGELGIPGANLVRRFREGDAPHRSLDQLAPDQLGEAGQDLRILWAGAADGQSRRGRRRGLHFPQIGQGLHLFDPEGQRKPGLHDLRFDNRGHGEMEERAVAHPCFADGGIQVGDDGRIDPLGQRQPGAVHPRVATPHRIELWRTDHIGQHPIAVERRRAGGLRLRPQCGQARLRGGGRFIPSGEIGIYLAQAGLARRQQRRRLRQQIFGERSELNLGMCDPGHGKSPPE